MVPLQVPAPAARSAEPFDCHTLPEQRTTGIQATACLRARLCLAALPVATLIMESPKVDMCYTCNYVEIMAKMIQIRHVPEDVHRKLKTRAAEAGMSLSDFLRKEVELVAQRPTLTQLLERLARRSSVRLRVSAAEVIRAERDQR